MLTAFEGEEVRATGVPAREEWTDEGRAAVLREEAGRAGEENMARSTMQLRHRVSSAFGECLECRLPLYVGTRRGRCCLQERDLRAERKDDTTPLARLGLRQDFGG